MVPIKMGRMNWTEIQDELRRRLKEKRGAQSAVARELGINRASVGQYTGGEKDIPLAHLDAICKVLGVTLDIKEIPASTAGESP